MLRLFLHLFRQGLLANDHLSMIWNQYQTRQGTATLMSFSGIRNAVANTAAYICLVRLIKLSICYLSVIVRTFRPKTVVASPIKSGSGSLMDLDVAPVPTFSVKNDSLKDLMCLNTDDSAGFCKQGEILDAYIGSSGTEKNRLDDMILTHLSDFSCQAKHQGVLEVSHESGSSLIRRRSAVET